LPKVIQDSIWTTTQLSLKYFLADKYCIDLQMVFRWSFAIVGLAHMHLIHMDFIHSYLIHIGWAHRSPLYAVLNLRGDL
jgi:hypothetical protein